MSKLGQIKLTGHMSEPVNPPVPDGVPDNLSAEWFADELNDVIHNAEGYNFTDEMVRMIEQRDAALLAQAAQELRSALYPNGVKHPQQGEWEWMITAVKNAAEEKAELVEALEEVMDKCRWDSGPDGSYPISDDEEATIKKAQELIAKHQAAEAVKS